MDYSQGPVGRVPFKKISSSKILDLVDREVAIAKENWDSFEMSWDFLENPFLRTQQPNLEQALYLKSKILTLWLK